MKKAKKVVILLAALALVGTVSSCNRKEKKAQREAIEQLNETMEKSNEAIDKLSKDAEKIFE